MNENNNHKNNKDHLSAVSLDKFLTVQEKDLQVREKEIELTAKSVANSHEYSLKALDAHANDRAHSREYEAKKDKERISLIKMVVIGFLLMFIVAIVKDKDQIVLDVIKYLAIFAGGFFTGGYTLSAKGKKSNNDTDNEG